MRNLGNNALIVSLLSYYEDPSAENYRSLLGEIYACSAEEHLLSSVEEIILRDKNAFSVSCATAGNASPYVNKAFIDDVKLIFSALQCVKNSDDFKYGRPLPLFDCANYEMLIYDLCRFYRANAYGEFIGNIAFGYADGTFTPLKVTDDITLRNLKEYATEKKLIENNICNFLDNLPYSHMLLYGDRGTGKSSTVHAVLNAYCKKGLRLIEVTKEKIEDIKKIKQQVADLPLKFIVFIDDLSLSEQDEKSSSLKAAIEGSVVDSKNTMIIATSNRRHIVRENFSDRENSVHPTDSAEEQLSLSDRFGLTVMFSSTDKAGYLSIVRQLAADIDLKSDAEQLETLAERWAILNGGRSPRRAKQFVDFIYACERSGREIDF